jgi:hypothetical protein
MKLVEEVNSSDPETQEAILATLKPTAIDVMRKTKPRRVTKKKYPCQNYDRCGNFCGKPDGLCLSCAMKRAHARRRKNQ